jgi:hypothetical protein
MTLGTVRSPVAAFLIGASHVLLVGLAQCAGERAAASVARCFTASGSVLGRVPNDAGGARVGPGWIRLDSSGIADRGTAVLVDADGASLGARWRRASGDSVAVVGFNDFLRVELSVKLDDAGLRGTSRATSDAALERDSTGVMREMDRRSTIEARTVTCDSMPGVRNAQ